MKFSGLIQRAVFSLREKNKHRLLRRRGEIHYREWIEKYDTIDAGAREAMSLRAESISNGPLLSVLMPVFNPRPDWLHEAIESVAKQIYPNWELCIADDASTDPHVREVLDHWSERDSRIKVVHRESNGHICAASNSGLEMASGAFVVLLDHDDKLAEDALLCVAETVGRFPMAAVIYSDEDKIGIDGARMEPYFKSDWNPDLFRSHNMVSHLGVYKRELVERVGKFREGYEGSQDYDLALRCIETVTEEQIVHIPRVLYHWRVHAQSTAAGSAAKPYAFDAGKRALESHLQRIGLPGTVSSNQEGSYRIDYRLPEPPPSVSVVVACANDKSWLGCVESVDDLTSYTEYKIILAAKAKVGIDAAKLALAKAAIGSQGFPNAVSGIELRNLAAASTSSDVLIFMDDACRAMSETWMRDLVSLASRPGTGAVAPKLVDRDMKLRGGGLMLGIQNAAGRIHYGIKPDRVGYFGRGVLLQNLSAVEPACMAVRKEVFDSVGGFDAVFEGIDAASIDFCLKLRRRGLVNVWAPFLMMRTLADNRDAIVVAPAVNVADHRLLTEKWGPTWLQDCAYNRNLSLIKTNFSLAQPPRADIVSPWFCGTRDIA